MAAGTYSCLVMLFMHAYIVHAPPAMQLGRAHAGRLCLPGGIILSVAHSWWAEGRRMKIYGPDGTSPAQRACAHPRAFVFRSALVF